ncbi:MAG TPA: hypothetical protein VHU60_07080 [Gaiellaceae bacterium]|nr:hypothetical protein [Gaiellaceae bacterium]
MDALAAPADPHLQRSRYSRSSRRPTHSVRLRAPGLVRGIKNRREKDMAAGDNKTAGISLGGIIVIAGILAIIFWSFWIGLVIVLIGLIAFGGFARGKWY